MVQSVEAIVVRQGDVCSVVQQQSQNVVPFLRDRVVEGSVTFHVLETRKQAFLVKAPSTFYYKSISTVKVVYISAVMDTWIGYVCTMGGINLGKFVMLFHSLLKGSC